MEVWLLDRAANAASVKIYGDDGDYAHMARWNGRWVIVNALWEPRRDATVS